MNTSGEKRGMETLIKAVRIFKLIIESSATNYSSNNELFF